MRTQPSDPSSGPSVDRGALRRGTLAASVLHDLPLEPRDDGVVVGSRWDERDAWTAVSWAQLETAVVGIDPESRTGRLRLRDWLRGFVALAHLGAVADGGASVRPQRAVALALPADHPLHPGPGWVVERVLGGLLDVGVGLRHVVEPDAAATPADRAAGVPDDGTDDALPAPPLTPGAPPERLAAPLFPAAAAAAGVDPRSWWPALAQHRDRMAVLAADRLQRDAGARQPASVLRPIGGCDVLTLLSGRWLRAHLAAEDGTGMRAVAVPMRSRGWFDLARIDPAFVGAAAVASALEDRGVSRPLLVTADEVGLAAGTLTVEELARASLAEPAGSRDLRARPELLG